MFGSKLKRFQGEFSCSREECSRKCWEFSPWELVSSRQLCGGTKETPFTTCFCLRCFFFTFCHGFHHRLNKPLGPGMIWNLLLPSILCRSKTRVDIYIYYIIVYIYICIIYIVYVLDCSCASIRKHNFLVILDCDSLVFTVNIFFLRLGFARNLTQKVKDSGYLATIVK